MFWVLLCLAIIAFRPTVHALGSLARWLDDVRYERARNARWKREEAAARAAEEYIERMSTLKTFTNELRLLGLRTMPDSIDELKKARKVAMFKAHPDRGGSAEKVVQVQRAYERIMEVA